MRSLTLRQRLFITAYLRNGGNGRLAAEQAGYRGKAAYLAVQASRLIRNDKVWGALSAAFTDLTPECLTRLMTARLAAVPQTEWTWNHWLKLFDLYAKCTGIYEQQGHNSQIGDVGFLQVQERTIQQAAASPQSSALRRLNAGHRELSITSDNET